MVCLLQLMLQQILKENQKKQKQTIDRVDIMY